jgi:hypothetical protein
MKREKKKANQADAGRCNGFKDDRKETQPHSRGVMKQKLQADAKECHQAGKHVSQIRKGISSGKWRKYAQMRSRRDAQRPNSSAIGS